MSVDDNEQVVEKALNKLVSSLIKIDEKRPDFGDIIVQDTVGDFAEEIKEEMKMEEYGNSQLANDQLKNFYYIENGNLMKKSVGRRNKVNTQKMIGLDNYF